MSENTKNERYYASSADDVLKSLDSSAAGLSADAVKQRRAQYGANEIQEGEQRTTLQKFIDQFKDAMILILLAAAALSVVLEGMEGMVDAIVILAVVIINAVLGVIQENRAEDAINSLREMSSPQARVRRGDDVQLINSKDIVPGDIVLLEAGDVVPADMRLIESNSLQIEEAALTGESVPVDKQIEAVDADAQIGDRTNIAFSSTNVTYGRGTGVVIGIGMNTEVGNIAQMIQNSEQKQTPLQRDMAKLTKFLTWAIVVISVVIFVIGMFQQRNWIQMLLTAISVAVAALPEGLPAISTIILALGTQKMSDRNALVRKLPAVETLGGTQVICSDKTGTLTQNKMTIERVFYNGKNHEASADIDFNEPVFKIMNMDNDSTISNDGSLAGDPTETAMIQFGFDKGYDVRKVLQEQPRVGEIAFDSTRKMSSTVHPVSAEEKAHGNFVMMTKGAPDVLIDNCTHYYENGEIHPLTPEYKAMLLDENEAMANEAFRVLAMAFKYFDEEKASYSSEEDERDLIFAGMVGEIDPERPEAKQAIVEANNAGIRVVMITGDHPVTAAAIARRLGIIEENEAFEDVVMTGAQLDEMSDQELAAHVEQYKVYARVAPEHKVRIVKAWQSDEHNKVVAMTGDGVNDAPSLKQADIGIGMGITGTEVSKGASDMVLADDNFATIVTAVEEGRKVFSNIQKAVQYLLSANLGEVLTIGIATLVGWEILEPIHILWINLVTDTFPAIALGLEKAESDVMQHTPRGRTSNLLSNGVLTSIIYQGLFEGGVTLFVYWYAIHIMQVEQINGVAPDAEAMAFLTLAFIQLAHAFNCKSVFKSLFSSNPFDNKAFNLGILVSAVLLLITVFIPGLNDAFGTSHLLGDPMAVQMWTVVILASLSVLLYVEIAKWIMRVTGYADKASNPTV
ncbi:MAG: cation-translocating P-type ATPase [Aerococcus sp.]|nr:cation-translocating P-type ATPase [Aerococcus sp.]